MTVRHAEAVWEGTLQEGAGTVRFGEGTFEGRYSFTSRFEDGPGTNPEELLGAAHATCFSMALSAGLGRAGFRPERVETTAHVHFDRLEEGWTVAKIVLETEARVPGITEQAFLEQAEAAKANCPISRALKAVPVELRARLVQA